MALESDAPASQGSGQLWGALALVGGFTALEWGFGARVAVVAGAVYALGEAGWTTWRDGRPSRVSLGLLAMVLVFGGLAWLDEGGDFARLTPAISDVVFAAIGLGAHLAGHPPIRVALMAQQPDLVLSADEAQYLDGMGLRLVVALLGHAAVVVWACMSVPDWALTIGGIGQLLWMMAFLGLEMAWVQWGPRRPPTAP